MAAANTNDHQNNEAIAGHASKTTLQKKGLLWFASLLKTETEIGGIDIPLFDHHRPDKEDVFVVETD